MNSNPTLAEIGSRARMADCALRSFRLLAEVDLGELQRGNQPRSLGLAVEP